jgi:hypothetical protein
MIAPGSLLENSWLRLGCSVLQSEGLRVQSKRCPRGRRWWGSSQDDWAGMRGLWAKARGTDQEEQAIFGAKRRWGIKTLDRRQDWVRETERKYTWSVLRRGRNYKWMINPDKTNLTNNLNCSLHVNIPCLSNRSAIIAVEAFPSHCW